MTAAQERGRHFLAVIAATETVMRLVQNPAAVRELQKRQQAISSWVQDAKERQERGEHESTIGALVPKTPACAVPGLLEATDPFEFLARVQLRPDPYDEPKYPRPTGYQLYLMSRENPMSMFEEQGEQPPAPRPESELQTTCRGILTELGYVWLGDLSGMEVVPVLREGPAGPALQLRLTHRCGHEGALMAGMGMDGISDDGAIMLGNLAEFAAKWREGHACPPHRPSPEHQARMDQWQRATVDEVQAAEELRPAVHVNRCTHDRSCD